ncbi:glycerophosphodiester phosphodiesterase family protein [Phyllobacterium zundukense]|uniref:Glycerophosphodiester phosphodiesterase family protein n=1 Tax=Phyllobacterium zundukense TaxID=1867719 RepID=A0ACD4D169_9HYPH|nr:glycerophosphodiester phosphodiesterase family protein [Phyllobacterium zundukense]UXN59585.1 glycerophosphodiester phosphodiesterase family protein [Phyllobacterium zundukense]
MKFAGSDPKVTEPEGGGTGSGIDDRQTTRREGGDAIVEGRSADSEKIHEGQAQLGPRPFFLVDDMSESPLKTQLKSCENGPFKRTDFAISHRGAPLQFPEHTKEGYLAAIRMGAGILECDVTVTKDKQLVCRHSQCDLAETTNILSTSLATQCAQPFSPAKNGKEASARCCTSDITLAEFKTLKGKMEGKNTKATTVTEFQQGTPDWRTDLYSTRRGMLMSHAESIALFAKAGVKMTPELKNLDRIPGGYSLDAYRQQVVDEYKAAKIDPSNVFIQSFNLPDVLYWIKHEPEFGQRSSYLYSPADSPTLVGDMEKLYAQGVRTISSNLAQLVTKNAEGKLTPSNAARAAKRAGIELVGWTLERDGMPKNTGDETYGLVDVLAQQVRVKGIFSDWPATTNYYANCMGLK